MRSGLEDLVVLERAPFAVAPLRQVHDDGVGVELGVALAAGLVPELRNDQVARTFDPGLAVDLAPGERPVLGRRDGGGRPPGRGPR